MLIFGREANSSSFTFISRLLLHLNYILRVHIIFYESKIKFAIRDKRLKNPAHAYNNLNTDSTCDIPNIYVYCFLCDESHKYHQAPEELLTLGRSSFRDVTTLTVFALRVSTLSRATSRCSPGIPPLYLLSLSP